MTYTKEPKIGYGLTAGSKVKAANEIAKDNICRLIFLNLVVDEEKVVSYQMTKAFSKLEKAQSVLNGRPKANIFEPYFASLLLTLRESWDASSFEQEALPDDIEPRGGNNE